MKLLVIEMLPRLLRTPGTYFIISNGCTYIDVSWFVNRQRRIENVTFDMALFNSSIVKGIQIEYRILSQSLIIAFFICLDILIPFLIRSLKGLFVNFTKIQQMLGGKMQLEIELFNILTEKRILGRNWIEFLVCDPSLSFFL